MQAFKKKSKGISGIEKKASLVVLGVAFLVACIITSLGFIDNNLGVDSEHLNISGPYGVSIALNEIDSIYISRKRPKAIRIRGYKMGYRKKGRFKNSEGEEFLMFINSRALPWIIIQKKDGSKIYFSHSRRSNEAVLRELREILPQR